MRSLVRLAILHLLAASAFAQGPPDYAKVSADCVPSLKPAEVPRDERRQQILVGIHESRFDYTLAQVPFETDLFAECYTDGRRTHRFQITSAMHWKLPEYAKGTISLGWNYLSRELTLINDNGFGLWNSRLSIVPEIIDRPLLVLGAEHPQPELRDVPKDYPAKQVTIYPIIAIVGDSPDALRRQTRYKLTGTADFLAQVAEEHSRQCVIIYLFSNGGGGSPPFESDGKTSSYANTLPAN